ncbi:MAG: orotate phosphoribosyltransferase [Candidatus Anammoxibacter sp.]
MTQFIQKEFDEFIIEQDVVGFFEEPIKLKSGRLANWYVNWRSVSEDVYLFDKLTDYVVSFVGDLNLKPDCFCGVPEGATKLSLITQLKWAKMQPNYGLGVYPLVMARGKVKDHGDPKDKYFIGIPKGRTIIIEDVTTTGESLLKTLDALLELEVSIIACIGVTDRNELRDDKKTVEEVVEERGVKYYTMSNASYLLHAACEKLQPSDNVVKSVEEYFERYGTKRIKLTNG